MFLENDCYGFFLGCFHKDLNINCLEVVYGKKHFFLALIFVCQLFHLCFFQNYEIPFEAIKCFVYI